VLTLKIPEVVVGHNIRSIRYAHDNQMSIIVNSKFKLHSYECAEAEAAKKVWTLSMRGLVPFSKPPNTITLNDELIIHHSRTKTKIACSKVHLFSLENVSTHTLENEVEYYRVIDWFDVYGSSENLKGSYQTQGPLMNDKIYRIHTFPTRRIDQKNNKRDMLVEQHLSGEDLQNLDYSDTSIRQKLQKLLLNQGIEVELALWKRDVYPIEKDFYHVVELSS